MAAEYFTTLYNDLKERSTSPFFVTFFTVSIFRKWEIIYTLLYFDNNCNLKCRIDYLKKTFGNIDYAGVLTNNILITFILLIVGFTCIFFTKGLSDVLYHNLIPWSRKTTVNKLVIDKSTYDTVREERDRYADELRNVKEINQSLDTQNSTHRVERNRLEALVNSKESEITSLEQHKTFLTNTTTEQKEKIETYIKKESEYTEMINDLTKKAVAEVNAKNIATIDATGLILRLTNDLEKQSLKGADLINRYPPQVKNDYLVLNQAGAATVLVDMYEKIEQEGMQYRKANFHDTTFKALKDTGVIENIKNDGNQPKDAIRLTTYGILMYMIIKAIKS